MLAEIERFVNWLRRRNPDAPTWRDYSYDLKPVADQVGELPPDAITFHDVDRFVTAQAARGFKPATSLYPFSPRPTRKTSRASEDLGSHFSERKSFHRLRLVMSS